MLLCVCMCLCVLCIDVIHEYFGILKDDAKLTFLCPCVWCLWQENVDEGSENDAFWEALGGKKEYEKKGSGQAEVRPVSLCVQCIRVCDDDVEA
jgi:hypothetical protein